jgi:hypothetical protein
VVGSGSGLRNPKAVGDESTPVVHVAEAVSGPLGRGKRGASLCITRLVELWACVWAGEEQGICVEQG